MGRRASVVALCIALGMSGCPKTELDPDPSLPDLATVPPYDIGIDATYKPGHTLLRLSNTVQNAGKGPLGLRGEVDPATGATKAYQIVYKAARSGGRFIDWEKDHERLVGTFVFSNHAGHNHWHFDRFAVYTLADEHLQPVANVGAGNKVSFCIEDFAKWGQNLEGMPDQQVYGCGNDSQGISVGWQDTYVNTLDDQWIDITGVPFGTYYVISEATAVFDESGDRTNNSAATKVRYDNTGVRVLEELDGAKLAARRHALGATPPPVTTTPPPPPTTPPMPPPPPPSAPSTPATSGLASTVGGP